MKKVIKIAIIAIGGLTVGLMAYSWISQQVELVATADRPYNPVPLTKKEIRTIQNALNDILTIEDVKKLALDMTANKLEFAEHNDISNGKANCVGYAQYCATICNYALKTKDDLFKGSYTVAPVVGYISFGKINLCNIARFLAPRKYKNFVKDHDFVAISHNNEAAGVNFIDPCLYDFFGNDLCTFTINTDYMDDAN